MPIVRRWITYRFQIIDLAIVSAFLGVVGSSTVHSQELMWCMRHVHEHVVLLSPISSLFSRMGVGEVAVWLMEMTQSFVIQLSKRCLFTFWVRHWRLLWWQVSKDSRHTFCYAHNMDVHVCGKWIDAHFKTLCMWPHLFIKFIQLCLSAFEWKTKTWFHLHWFIKCYQWLSLIVFSSDLVCLSWGIKCH